MDGSSILALSVALDRAVPETIAQLMLDVERLRAEVRELNALVADWATYGAALEHMLEAAEHTCGGALMALSQPEPEVAMAWALLHDILEPMVVPTSDESVESEM